MADQGRITNPYIGLRPFEDRYKDYFFGRDRQIDELFDRVYLNNFIAVLGYSGSGKSSLVKCGLLPRLEEDNKYDKHNKWKIVITNPGTYSPIPKLAKSLLPLFGDKSEEMEGFVESLLLSSSKGLLEAIEHSDIDEGDNLLLLVDQFEELFRYSRHEVAEEGNSNAELFVNLLLTACKSIGSRIFIVITMRSEFLGECARFYGLPEVINGGQYLIPPMTREELKSVIVSPITKYNEVNGTQIQLSRACVSRILNDVPNDQDQLPILQHALSRMWVEWGNKEDGGTISLEHYERPGGVKKALNEHADDIYKNQLSTLNLGSDVDYMLVCEKLFKSITEKNEEGFEIRRATSYPRLAHIIGESEETIHYVVEAFKSDGSLLIEFPQKNDDGVLETIIDIPHESLIRKWNNLTFWLDQESEASSLYRKLFERQREVLKGSGAEYLSEFELNNAKKWQEEMRPNAFWAERYDELIRKELDQSTLDRLEAAGLSTKSFFPGVVDFINHSESVLNEVKSAKEKAVERRRKRTIRRFSFILVAIMCFAIYAYALKSEAEDERKIADSERTKAVEAFKESERLRVVAENQTKIAQKAYNTAESERSRADSLRFKAEAAETEALNQADIAKKRTIEAENARKSAETSRQEAIVQKDRAENALGAAQVARNEAIQAEKKAEFLRKIEEAKRLSLEALKELELASTNDGAETLARLTNAKRDALAAYDLINELRSASDEELQSLEIDRTQDLVFNEIYLALSAADQKLNPKRSYQVGVNILDMHVVSDSMLVVADQEGYIHFLSIEMNTIHAQPLTGISSNKVRFHNELDEINQVMFRSPYLYCTTLIEKAIYGINVTLGESFNGRRKLALNYEGSPFGERSLMYLDKTSDRVFARQLTGADTVIFLSNVDDVSPLSFEFLQIREAMNKVADGFLLSSNRVNLEFISPNQTIDYAVIKEEKILFGTHSGQIWAYDGTWKKELSESELKKGKRISDTHALSVTGVDLAESGRQYLLASSGNDGAHLTYLDVQMKELVVYELVGHEGQVNGIKIRGNQSVITYGRDGMIRIWPNSEAQAADWVKKSKP